MSGQFRTLAMFKNHAGTSMYTIHCIGILSEGAICNERRSFVRRRKEFSFDTCPVLAPTASLPDPKKGSKV